MWQNSKTKKGDKTKKKLNLEEKITQKFIKLKKSKCDKLKI